MSPASYTLGQQTRKFSKLSQQLKLPPRSQPMNNFPLAVLLRSVRDAADDARRAGFTDHASKIEAAANLLTNGAIDPVGKIPEFKYCAVQLTAGGSLVAQRGYSDPAGPA